MTHIDNLIERYPALTICRDQIEAAVIAILDMYKNGGSLLICGNGGSAADCEHISGELLKGFLLKRPLKDSEKSDIPSDIADKLQGGIKAIPLTSLSALGTAFSNDVNPDLVYAQLVSVFGGKNDVFLGISTSGNAKNVCAAAEVARARGLKTFGLTGMGGGRLSDICD
jgi:D-sedoheptulose 7-phosphate isomerase